MPKHPPPITPEGFLATQDLKDRGWAARLICEFLGEHDSVRPNGLKMGRRKLLPVKLYREDWAAEAEREEDFLVAQAKAMDARERAERAGRTRRANRERVLAALAQEWTPSIRVLPIRKGAVRLAREPYAGALAKELKRVEATGRLTTQEERFVKKALASAYTWFPVPKTEESEPVARYGVRNDGWE